MHCVHNIKGDWFVEGVDDNGSGVAAMLEVVRQVTKINSRGTKRQNTIMFLSFDAQELGKYIRAMFCHNEMCISLKLRPEKA